MIETIRYLRWKRRARKAVEEKLTANCAECDDPIVPGDFVAIGIRKDKTEVLVHAGYHFSLTSRTAFCLTGALGCGIWDGKTVVRTQEPLVAKAIRTGQVEIM